MESNKTVLRNFPLKVLFSPMAADGNFDSQFSKSVHRDFFDARTAVSTKTNHFLHRCVFTTAGLLCVRQTLRQHGCTTGRLSRQRVFRLLGINEIHVFVRAERVFFFCYLGLCVIKDRRGIKNIDLTGFNEECLICQTYGLIIFFFSV